MTEPTILSITIERHENAPSAPSSGTSRYYYRAETSDDLAMLGFGDSIREAVEDLLSQIDKLASRIIADRILDDRREG